MKRRKSCEPTPGSLEDQVNGVVDGEQSEHQRFIETWCDCYLRHFGVPYSFSGGRDGRAVKALLEKRRLTVEQVMDVVTKAWGGKASSPFLAERCREIHGVESEWNKLQSSVTAPIKVAVPIKVNGRLHGVNDAAGQTDWAKRLDEELDAVEQDGKEVAND